MWVECEWNHLNIHPWATSTSPNLGPRARIFLCLYTKVMIWFYVSRYARIGQLYVVLYLAKEKFYRSGRSKLPIWGEMGIVALQSLLLHIIIAQVWYENVAMPESYTVLLQILLIRWVLQYFVEVRAGIWAATTQNTDFIIRRQVRTTNTSKAGRNASLDTPERLKWSRHGLGTGVGDERDETVWKSSHFSWIFAYIHLLRLYKYFSATCLPIRQSTDHKYISSLVSFLLQLCSAVHWQVCRCFCDCRSVSFRCSS